MIGAVEGNVRGRGRGVGMVEGRLSVDVCELRRVEVERVCGSGEARDTVGI